MVKYQIKVKCHIIQDGRIINLLVVNAEAEAFPNHNVPATTQPDIQLSLRFSHILRKLWIQGYLEMFKFQGTLLRHFLEHLDWPSKHGPPPDPSSLTAQRSFALSGSPLPEIHWFGAEISDEIYEDIFLLL